MNATATLERPAAPAPAPALEVVQETAHHLFIHLAADEWGNDLMDKVAAQAFAEHKERPLVVTVHEHAGWYLDFFEHQGRIITIGTANDRARFGDTVKAIWERLNAGKWTDAGCIRRDDLPVYGPQPRPAPCENCGKCGPLHKVKYADDSGIGSMMVCPGCD